MSDYYAPCKELDECNALIEQYWNTKRYELCFAGHLKLAEKGYPLAAQNGDRDAQFNLGWFYENGIIVPKDLEIANVWYHKAAAQQQTDALEKLK